MEGAGWMDGAGGRAPPSVPGAGGSGGSVPPVQAACVWPSPSTHLPPLQSSSVVHGRGRRQSERA